MKNCVLKEYRRLQPRREEGTPQLARSGRNRGIWQDRLKNMLRPSRSAAGTGICSASRASRQESRGVPESPVPSGEYREYTYRRLPENSEISVSASSSAPSSQFRST